MFPEQSKIRITTYVKVSIKVRRTNNMQIVADHFTVRWIIEIRITPCYVFSHDGAGQQCCYDLAGYLMMTTDNKWGGKPRRYHNLGLLPWNEANKIPTLSHYLNDIAPFYFCCMWQGDQSNGCQRLRYERRRSQDCVGYQPPGGGNL